jgi:hypothetical protein
MLEQLVHILPHGIKQRSVIHTSLSLCLNFPKERFYSGRYCYKTDLQKTPHSVRRSTLVCSLCTVHDKKIEGKVFFVLIMNILQKSFY